MSVPERLALQLNMADQANKSAGRGIGRMRMGDAPRIALIAQERSHISHGSEGGLGATYDVHSLLSEPPVLT